MRVKADLIADLASRAWSILLSLPPCQTHWTRRKVITTVLSVVFSVYLFLFIYQKLVFVPDRLLFLPTHSPQTYLGCTNPNSKERLLPGFNQDISESSKATTIIIYNYYDHEGSANNFKFFLKHGLHDRPDTHFLFIMSSQPCIAIPERRNIGVIPAPNGCLGYSAVKSIVSRFRIDKVYANILITGSWVRGPYMPMWSHSCWTDAFIHMLDENHPMVGTGYRCFSPDGNLKPHLHPTLWAFKQSALLPVLSEFHCPHNEETASIRAQISHYEVLRLMNKSIATVGTSLFSEPLEHCPQRWLYQPHPYEGIFINPRLPWHLKYPYEIDIRNDDDTSHWEHWKYADEAMYYSQYDSRVFCNK